MKNPKIKILLIIVIGLILIDQISKILILKFINSNIIIIPKLLEFEIVKNNGIAFGLNNGNFKNIIITILVLILIINFIKNQKDVIDNKTMISLALILGGGISNLIDRICRGGVVDFIKISTFPIFNIADSVIVIGWILLIINIVKFYNNNDI